MATDAAHEQAKSNVTSAIAPTEDSLVWREYVFFSTTTEEESIMKRIQERHSPNGTVIEYNTKFILHIVEGILRASTGISSVEDAHFDESEINALLSNLHDDLTDPINKISSEFICKTHVGGDERDTTEELFQSLAHYSWEAKVVIAFAAFAKNYAQFWLVAQLFRTNPLARSIADLMEMDEIMASSQVFQVRIKALTDLVNAMLDVTKSILEFNHLFHQGDIDAEDKKVPSAHIAIAAYWTMRCIVACTSIITYFMAMGLEYITMAFEDWEVDSLAHNLVQIKDHMQKQKKLYRLKLDEKRQYDAVLALKRLFDMPHFDNMKILRALFCASDDQLSLYDGATMARTTLQVLRMKNVMLLISGLDIPPQELEFLIVIYLDSRQAWVSHENRFEFVWLPIIDRSVPLTQETLQSIERGQNIMPWYSVAQPWLIDPAVIRFVKEVWKYGNKPLLLVLDPKGKVSNYDALNMFWIWGGLAFPFSNTTEEALWNEASWNMELLMGFIDTTAVSWLSSRRFVCLYGGEDIVWIRRFTAAARNIARQLNIDLEVLYVGKANPRERISRINKGIMLENLSSTFPADIYIWFFWERLNCMWKSREKQGLSMENDEIMNQIIAILTYDSSDLEWAIFSRGSTGETAKQMGEIMLQTLQDFDKWRNQVGDKQDFVHVLNEQLRGRHPDHHCSRLLYPGTTGRVLPRVTCPECGLVMDNHLMYLCCKR